MGGVLLVMLEYDIEITLKNLGKAREVFCIGWAPLFIKDIMTF